jgi:aminoglycoside 6'-N-acetyltransferase I
MEINLITKNDVPKCAEAFTAAYNQFPWNYNWKLPDAIKYLNEYVESPQFRGFIVYDEQQVAGALFGHTKTWWTNNQFMIDELFISPDKQGKGYGKILLSHAEQYAKKDSIELITLMTNKFMPALQFYDKNDFNKVDQYVFMFKQLSS